jgi:hypothetical protein
MFIYLNHFLFSFIFLTLIFFGIKRIKKIEFGFSDSLFIKDQVYVAIISLIFTCSYFYLDKIFILITLPIVLIVFFDTILLCTFGMTITFENIKIFFQGVDSFKGEEKKIIDYLKSCHWTFGLLAMVFSLYLYSLY